MTANGTPSQVPCPSYVFVGRRPESDSDLIPVLAQAARREEAGADDAFVHLLDHGPYIRLKAADAVVATVPRLRARMAETLRRYLDDPRADPAPAPARDPWETAIALAVLDPADTARADELCRARSGDPNLWLVDRYTALGPAQLRLGSRWIAEAALRGRRGGDIRRLLPRLTGLGPAAEPELRRLVEELTAAGEAPGTHVGDLSAGPAWLLPLAAEVALRSLRMAPDRFIAPGPFDYGQGDGWRNGFDAPARLLALGEEWREPVVRELEAVVDGPAHHPELRRRAAAALAPADPDAERAARARLDSAGVPDPRAAVPEAEIPAAVEEAWQRIEDLLRERAPGAYATLMSHGGITPAEAEVIARRMPVPPDAMASLRRHRLVTLGNIHNPAWAGWPPITHEDVYRAVGGGFDDHADPDCDDFGDFPFHMMNGWLISLRCFADSLARGEWTER